MKDFLISVSDSSLVKQINDDIKKINARTEKYGLALSEKDVDIIIKHKSKSLRNNGRVEFGAGIITKMISAFCDSPYISQDDYVETINDLIEIFYYYKNETMDKISDDALIDFMKKCFDNKCQGNIELLRHKYLGKVAQNVKHGKANYFDMDEDMGLDNKELEDEVKNDG